MKQTMTKQQLVRLYTFNFYIIIHSNIHITKFKMHKYCAVVHVNQYIIKVPYNINCA